MTRRSETVSGRRVETEVYRQEEGGGTVQLVFHYDPGLGYLPRYIRGWSWSASPGRDRSNVRELYLVSASPCAAGGFVPTEWVETFFAVKNFNPNSPDYSDDMPLRPAGRVSLTHFKIVELGNLEGDAAMDQLQEVKQLASFGGVVKLPPGTTRLTLDRIKTLLGKRVDTPRQSALPSPPARPQAKPIAPVLWIVGILLASGVAGAFALRRAMALHLAVLALYVLPGCTGSQQSVPRLAASFAQPSVLYESGPGGVDLTLKVTNEWSRTLKVVNVDGGCSCRRIDRSGLPFTPRPRAATSKSGTGRKGRWSLPTWASCSLRTSGTSRARQEYGPCRGTASVRSQSPFPRFLKPRESSTSSWLTGRSSRRDPIMNPSISFHPTRDLSSAPSWTNTRTWWKISVTTNSGTRPIGSP